MKARKIQRKGLTKKQQLLLRSLQGKLKTCLDKYEEDPNEGYRYMLRLVLASQIRSLRHLHKLDLKNISGDEDIRYQTYIKGRNATTMTINRSLEQNLDRYSTLMEKI